MSFKTWLKAHAADKALAPLREELACLFTERCSVLDIGCGTGDLLFKTAHKIHRGCGIDLDKDMILFAQEQQQKHHVNNLSFINGDALLTEIDTYDIATCTLCIHELKPNQACMLLQRMALHAQRILIADYHQAHSLLAKACIELDECCSGHYFRFKAYKRHGQITGYAQQCGLEVTQCIKSCIDGISIWELKGQKTHTTNSSRSQKAIHD
ncbi:class I SAM-dependent methyltransferase [Agaribacterium sp. ZY112]|uniref:class I SAM-dependent methyltransferase n=1 Tax=Agaribacterium sp. ZY112 TaxID=3233574 RepID=UPI0035231520